MERCQRLLKSKEEEFISEVQSQYTHSLDAVQEQQTSMKSSLTAIEKQANLINHAFSCLPEALLAVQEPMLFGIVESSQQLLAGFKKQ